jgi:hypothetical protein
MKHVIIRLFYRCATCVVNSSPATKIPNGAANRFVPVLASPKAIWLAESVLVSPGRVQIRIR